MINHAELRPPSNINGCSANDKFANRLETQRSLSSNATNGFCLVTHPLSGEFNDPGNIVECVLSPTSLRLGEGVKSYMYEHVLGRMTN